MDPQETRVESEREAKKQKKKHHDPNQEGDNRFFRPQEQKTESRRETKDFHPQGNRVI